AKYPRFKEEALGVQPADLATLLYTSGTTGQPKGVMLTHDNICSNVRACVETLRVSQDDSCLALLPLSHILERMVEYYFLHVGVTINYAESIDAFAQNLQDVRPTIVAAVPRVYEKVYARVLENAHTGGAVKRGMFQWAQPGGPTEDRGRRRDPGQGRQYHAGLLQQAGGDARGDRCGGLVPHGGHRRAGCRRLPQDHRPEEGPVEDRGWEVHRAAADREHGPAEQVRGERRRARRPAQVPDHPDRAQLRSARAVGHGAEPHLRVPGRA